MAPRVRLSVASRARRACLRGSSAHPTPLLDTIQPSCSCARVGSKHEFLKEMAEEVTKMINEAIERLESDPQPADHDHGVDAHSEAPSVNGSSP